MLLTRVVGIWSTGKPAITAPFVELSFKSSGFPASNRHSRRLAFDAWLLASSGPRCVAYLFLFTALLAVSIVVPAGGYSVPRAFSYVLFAWYGAFLLVGCLVEADVIPESALCSWLPYDSHGDCEPQS